MNSFISSINAITELLKVAEKFGIINIILIIIVLYAIVMIKGVLKDKERKYYYDTMVKEKNNNIEQLADDNRRYRDIYLKSFKGIDEKIYKEISAETVNMTKGV